MASNSTSVLGIYKTIDAADAAVEVLMKSGLTQDDVSILLPDNDSTRQLAVEKNTKAPEGTATGGVAGGAIGGAVGLLAGIGSLSIPGLGPFIAAGPIMAALAGLGVGGAVGGLIGALTGMGIPEYEAKRYAGRVKDGGILLSVHCDSTAEVPNLQKLLQRTGAEDVSSTTEATINAIVTDEVHSTWTRP